jgi:tetratricopeptide (TPR) repeat protein/Cdc6-like AAA superfamily ATPase
VVVSNESIGESSYDVFLSYNSADHGAVEEVARKLSDAGLEPFLDRWDLAPGLPWRSKLESTLSSCKAIAIFVGPGEMGSWQQREVDVALDLQSRRPNLPVIPVLLPGCEPPLGFLRQLTWVDLRTKALDQGISILAKAALGETPSPALQRHFDAVRASICPYRGLLPFREEDAPFFFGREAAIDKLMHAVQHQSFLAVVGASGSGKSSVVRAGLVPRLRSDRQTTWETVILFPTDQPLKALARALVPLLQPAMGEVDRLAEASKLADHFRSATISLHDLVERILEKQSGTHRVLIAVDQFEELYTLGSDEETRRRFLDELLAASSRTGSKTNVVLTLRGAFIDRALADRQLSDRLQDAQINLGPMTHEELESAIRKPAEKIQLEFEPGLVKRILNDVGDEPGNLPLLEFVLKGLWDMRRGQVLLGETYDSIGGLQGAVTTKADEFLKGLSLAEQTILRRVFLRIVRPSESGLDTRRRAAFTELPPEATELVLKLSEERLLVTNQPPGGLERTIEVAHEALISNWSTLRAWVNEDREFLLWRDRHGTLIKEWERAQESDDALLRGPLLVEAQKWFDQRSQDLSDHERKFISASRAQRERRAREEDEHQQRDLEAARKLAEEQKRRAELSEEREKEQKQTASKLRRLAYAAAAAAVAAVILLILSIVVWRQSESARSAAEEARDQADGLIEFMLYDLHDRLKPLGRLDVLGDVAKRAKEYVDSLPKELATTPGLEQQAFVLNNLGNVLWAQGELQDALEAFRQTLKIRQTLAEQDKPNSVRQRNLSASYEKIGQVLVAQGRLQDALEAYQQSLAISKRLTEQDKSRPDWGRDLAVRYNEVGDTLVAQGQLQDALEAYQQSLAISKRLAERDKSNSIRQRDLIVAFYKVGTTTARIEGKSNVTQAGALLRQGLELANGYYGPGPSEIYR